VTQLANRRTAVVAALALFLLLFPMFASEFWIVSIGIKSMWLGIVALSLIFLAGYVGMVSLAQTAVYGSTGYVVANLTVVQGWPTWPAVAVAILAAVAVATVAAVVASRSYGIYFLMLTFAIGVFLFYFALQYRPFTQGFSGINGVSAPSLFGIQLTNPTNFYYMALVVATGAYLAVRHVTRTPFGLTLQGIRDGHERMAALGYNVALHRIAAFAFAGLIAALGGVLAVWYNGQISPGSIDITRIIDILVVAVIGGLYRLQGAWVGAIALTLLQAYANDITNRVNTLIGAVFVLILLLSPGGLVGIGEDVGRRIRSWRGRDPRPATAEVNTG
jgi:branched-chain amino acid transport system permease protein